MTEVVVRGKSAKNYQEAMYDNLDKIALIDENQAKVADQVYQQIKSYKDMIKQTVKKKLAHYVTQQVAESADPETQMNDLQMLQMVAEAQFVLDELEREQRRIIKFKRAESKKITCLFCNHRGRSIIDERQPWITYIIVLALLISMGLWSFFLLPFIVGLLRQQTHRCQKCLNQFKEDSLFESLNEKLLEVSFMNFGIIVKRRTLLKSLVFVIACFLLAFIIKRRSLSDVITEDQLPEQNLTWQRFQNDCQGGQTNHKSMWNFDQLYKGKVVKWQGIVVRVDSYDEDDDDNDLLWINQEAEQKHKIQSVDILVNMFTDKEFDILLTFDTNHFVKNQQTIDKLHTGSIIEFKGHITRIGNKQQKDENGAVQLNVFEIIDQHQQNLNQAHHLLHKDGRYN